MASLLQQPIGYTARATSTNQRPRTRLPGQASIKFPVLGLCTGQQAPSHPLRRSRRYRLSWLGFWAWQVHRPRSRKMGKPKCGLCPDESVRKPSLAQTLPNLKSKLSVEEAAKMVASLCSSSWLTATLAADCLYRGEVGPCGTVTQAMIKSRKSMQDVHHAARLASQPDLLNAVAYGPSGAEYFAELEDYLLSIRRRSVGQHVHWENLSEACKVLLARCRNFCITTQK